MNISTEMKKLKDKKIMWQKTTREGLDLDYAVIVPRYLADALFKNLEETVTYESAEKSKVQIFGKWYNIPRKQVAFGDPGTTYKFSGVTVPAKPWTASLQAVREMLFGVTGNNFNFVLVNKYRNGSDHIGEHRDAEPDLDANAPIASLSLGQSRHFVLKHGDARKKGTEKKNIPIVKILLEHGSILMMNPPTNKIWYHSLPPRKTANGVRINLTFRCIVNK